MVENEPKRILVVDDCEHTRYLYSRHLEHPCLHIFYSDSVMFALDVLREAESFFDLAITDLNMPVLTGYDFIKAVQSDKDIPFKPKIIMSTAMIVPGEIDKALNMGVCAVIENPFSRSRLLSEIENQLFIDLQ